MNSNIIEKFNEHIMPTYGRYPVSMNCGHGRMCKDEDGQKYIDFGSGIGTNSLGFCDSSWVEAVCEQVHKIQHTSNYYYTEIQADFAEKLCNITGMSKMFFGNSGAEANECAIKIARKYSFDKYGKDRNKIITLVNSFHGRTIATLSATGQDVFHNYFFPFVGGFDYAEANNIKDLDSKIDDTVCAIMIEFIQGEGGVLNLEKDFVNHIAQICREKDLVFIADEVQTGVGRTGKFLAAEHYGVKPDVVTLAKGIAGGLPMGVCLADEKCCNVLTKGTHGSTFGGNPVSCAGGLAVLNRVTADGFLDEVNEKSKYLREKLLSIDEVESLSGTGLMVGIKLKSKNAADTVAKALEKGLLLLTAKDKVRLLPPLTITYEEIDKGISIMEEILK
ncbi:MAG TPA: aspartate aminotransferase family protein [Ruminococcus sp.]|nr:aspartate aminotransferase family protein [Ruminococcus sp.]